MKDIYLFNWLALEKFAPSGRVRHITYFAAAASEHGIDVAERVERVRSLSEEPLTVHRLAGDHFSIVVGDDSRATADLLSTELSEQLVLTIDASANGSQLLRVSRVQI